MDDEWSPRSDVADAVFCTLGEDAPTSPVPVRSDLTQSAEDISRPSNRTIRVPTASEHAQSPPHPSDYQRDSTEYRRAVEDFFKLSIDPPADPYVVWLRSYALYDSSSNRHTFTHIDRIRKHGRDWRKYQQNSFFGGGEELYDSGKTLSRILDDHRDSNEERMPISIYDLREAHNSLCKAVAGIELGASTLRTNSRALTLAKSLAGEIARGMFRVLLKSESPREPIVKLSGEVKVRLNMWIREKNISGWLWTSQEEEIQRSRSRIEKGFDQAWNRFNVFSRGGVDAMTRKRSERELDGLSWRHELTYVDFVIMEYYPFRPHPWPWEDDSAVLQSENDDASDGRRLSSEQLRDIRTWMKKDKTLHPQGWKDDEWRGLQGWWTHMEDLLKGYQDDILLTKRFADSSLNLLTEIMKIDGSASANDLNTAREVETDFYRLAIYNYELKIQTRYLDEDKSRFRCLCNDIFKLLDKRLRSKELKQGLDTLIKKQDHYRNTFMDFAAVAIFFSSITATTLQFSFSAADQSVTSTVVNLCWFASLVLSVTSATNSFLGAIVHQSPEYLRPSANIDFRILQAWFKFVPPALLSISGLLFLGGICAFTYLATSTSPNQGPLVKHVTLSLTSINVFALVVMIILAFTRVLHCIAGPILAYRPIQLLCTLIHLKAQIVFIWGIFILIVLPALLLDSLCGLIRYRTLLVSGENGSWFGAGAVKILHLLEPVADRYHYGMEGFARDSFDARWKLRSFFRDIPVTLKKIVLGLSPFRSSNTQKPSVA